MKKSRKTILIITVLLLIQVVIALLFEENELILQISIISLGIIIGGIAFYFILKEYPVKTMIDNEIMQGKVSSLDLLKRSIIISLVIVLYTFFLIGSTVSTSNTILNTLDGTITIVVILFGIYFLYIAAYLLYRSKENNISWFTVLAICIIILSASYFIFVSFVTVLDLLV